MVKTCLLCTITPPKRVRKLIGARRSNYYLPGQCLVIDSLILPRSQYGKSAALILVDACTGYISIYPSANLMAETAKTNLAHYLGSHPLPQEIKSDFGPEFQKDLDVFLAQYNITLAASKPFCKGSTSNAESAIRLVKEALRQLCLTHTHNWPQMIPILLHGLNSQGLYGTTTSRSQLYFSPYSYVNALRLDNLLFPEQLFNETYDKLNLIIKRRQQRLTKKQILDKTQYQEGNIILAVNHPHQRSKPGTGDDGERGSLRKSSVPRQT